MRPRLVAGEGNQRPAAAAGNPDRFNEAPAGGRGRHDLRGAILSQTNASMRPRLVAGEGLVALVMASNVLAVASMRPRLVAGEGVECDLAVLQLQLASMRPRLVAGEGE